MGFVFRRPQLDKVHLVGLQNSTIPAYVQNLAVKSLKFLPSYRPQGRKQCADELVRMSRTLECEAYFGGGVDGADKDRHATTYLSDGCWRPKHLMSTQKRVSKPSSDCQRRNWRKLGVRVWLLQSSRT